MVLSSRSPRILNCERQYVLDSINFARRNTLFTASMVTSLFQPSFESTVGSTTSHMEQSLTSFHIPYGNKRLLPTSSGDMDSIINFLKQNLLNPYPCPQSNDAVLVEDSASESCPEPQKKKRKTKPDDTKFRPYQAEKWHEKYEELVDYKNKYGNAMVPHTFPDNPPLARWVKRQRHQRVLQKRGDPRSSCTPERIALLDALGFVWDSHEISWIQRLDELHAYKKEHGHCLVPSTYPKNAQLATWVKCQRRQYKLFAEGKTSNITQERIDQLVEVGFEWELRALPKPITSAVEAENSAIGDESFLSFLEVFSDLSDSDDTEDSDEPLPANFGW